MTLLLLGSAWSAQVTARSPRYRGAITGPVLGEARHVVECAIHDLAEARDFPARAFQFRGQGVDARVGRPVASPQPRVQRDRLGQGIRPKFVKKNSAASLKLALDEIVSARQPRMRP